MAPFAGIIPVFLNALVTCADENEELVVMLRQRFDGLSGRPGVFLAGNGTTSVDAKRTWGRRMRVRSFAARLVGCLTIASMALASQGARADGTTRSRSIERRGPVVAADLDEHEELEEITDSVLQAGFFGRKSGRRRCDCAVPYCPHVIERPRPETESSDRPSEPTPVDEAPPSMPEPSENFVASSLAAPTSSRTLAPNMLGDFLGSLYQGAAPAFPADVTGGLVTGRDIGEQRIIKRYKVADFTSPAPQSRVIYSYNFFSDVFETTGDVHRNFFGIERAFLDRRFSIEVKSSVNTFTSFAGESDQTLFGDLRTVIKGVLLRRESFLLSSGLAVGWPAGPTPPRNVPRIYVFAPFVGYRYEAENAAWFVQGFEQLDIPDHSDDQLLLHTDVGVGFWLRRYDESRTIRAIAPSAELHLYSPLGASPSGSLTALVLNDVLNATVGMTIYVGSGLQFATGLGIPLSTNKDYDVEAQFHAQWNY